MPCEKPLNAWRRLGSDGSGDLQLRCPSGPPGHGWAWDESTGLRHEYAGFENLYLPCGRCTGCRVSRAREWAVRCSLEAARHDESSFVTLTYDEEHCPVSLRKADLSGWLKRIRARLAPRRIKFFACGEYGERTARPHYHALVFGASEPSLFQDAWPAGFVRTDAPLTPAAIAYVSGYVSKKYGELGREFVDTSTGEVIDRCPEFRLMSRGGRSGSGIGGDVRDRHWRSWRKSAHWQGLEVPVPRYLHEGWKKRATPQEIERLRDERRSEARRVDRQGLAAAHRRSEVRQEQKASTRRKF